MKPSVLRYWETEFRTIRTEKSRSNQRLYSRKTVEHILRIKELLYAQGFTIAGARKRLRSGAPEPGDEQLDGGTAPVASKKLVDRLRREVRELLQLVDE